MERASARETTVRVAAGAVAKKLLNAFGILVQSHVVQLGSVLNHKKIPFFLNINHIADQSPVRMLDKKGEKKSMALIDKAKVDGDTLGGIFRDSHIGCPSRAGKPCSMGS